MFKRVKIIIVTAICGVAAVYFMIFGYFWTGIIMSAVVVNMVVFLRSSSRYFLNDCMDELVMSGSVRTREDVICCFVESDIRILGYDIEVPLKPGNIRVASAKKEWYQEDDLETFSPDILGFRLQMAHGDATAFRTVAQRPASEFTHGAVWFDVALDMDDEIVYDIVAVWR